jgi:hypothetical protein
MPTEATKVQKPSTCQFGVSMRWQYFAISSGHGSSAKGFMSHIIEGTCVNGDGALEILKLS